MNFNSKTIYVTACYKLLIASVVRRAIRRAPMLSTDSIAKLAPFSFFTAVSRNPAMVSLTIQPRSKQKLSICFV